MKTTTDHTHDAHDRAEQLREHLEGVRMHHEKGHLALARNSLAQARNAVRHLVVLLDALNMRLEAEATAAREKAS